MPRRIESNNDRSLSARREFLAKCGRLAVVTPPAVTLMLAASQRNFAVAQSGGAPGLRASETRGQTRSFHPNNGFGNRGGDGVPGRSLHDDRGR